VITGQPDRAAGGTWPATIAYTLIAIVMTWPLSRGLGTWIAGDMGDPVFNSWVLMWTGGQVLAMLGGDLNALHQYWHGNIFAPEPLTLAYSEHLTPQMLQALPIWATTGNIILAYNLLFLSTFILSGVGMYLLVRELTGRRTAAFVAGLAFAYAPYRLSQYAHLQVLSSYWMPLVLLGLRRYFVTRPSTTLGPPRAGSRGAALPLVGAAAALTLQNLSCGYYLLFFTPFAGLYAIYEIAHRRLWRDWWMWRSLAIAAVAVIVCSWPFISPYLQVRKGGDVGVRPMEEIITLSADTHAYATVSSFSRLWGDTMDALRRGEGEGFPGLTILALAAIAGVWAVRRAFRAAGWRSDRAWQRAAAIGLAALLAVDIAALLVLFVNGSLPWTVEGRPFRNSDPLLVALLLLPILAIALVPGWRRAIGELHRASAVGFFIDAAIVAALLTLGPRIQAGGTMLGIGPYYWLWEYVPGFDGVRAPARFLMIVALFLAILAGFGVAALLARWPKAARAVAAVAIAGILAECWMVPMPTNVRMPMRYYELTPRQLQIGDAVSPIYQYVKQATGKFTLIEFPFGEPPYEILATFYAGYHRKPLVNGFSGFFPEGYLRRSTFLQYVPFDLEAATKALGSTGATHALLHDAAFPDGRSAEIAAWLESTGATMIMKYGTDRLFRLK
jgi:hypothetical protein